MREAATFELAMRLRHQGAPLGEVFSFMSGLYFRGKLAYANRFANPPADVNGSWVITSSRGLISPETVVSRVELKALAANQVSDADAIYVETLTRAARDLHNVIGSACRVVLLGSIATAKYIEPLIAVFGEQLVFPIDFVGRGDLSRGGLLLRAVQTNHELSYAPAKSATRHGPRPARLSPKVTSPFRHVPK
jgi:hypothetical protein